MPAIRRKDASISKAEKVKTNGEDYDDAIIKFKTTLRITPKTAKHLCMSHVQLQFNSDGMGYTTVETLQSPKITPDSLEVQMQEYLERTKQTFPSAPKRSGAMYRVAFRRILWTARATEKERDMYPERMSCNYWSNKSIAAREGGTTEKKLEKAKAEKSAKMTDVKVEA